MVDLRQNLTVDDYFSAWEYLASKADAQRKAAEEQKQAQAIAQLHRRGGMG